MIITPEILDQAIADLRAGHSRSEVLSRYPEVSSELAGLLDISMVASHLPKTIVPRAMKRQKFADKKLAWYSVASLFHYSRYAVIPASLVFMLFAGKALGNATEKSLPGDTLYTVKRASENVQLTLTRDQNKVAQLNVEFTQKRLEEVKQAVSSGNATQKAAAITALKEQSDKTLATASPVAVASAITNKDNSLLNNLVAINKEQKSVLSSIEPSSDVSDVASTSLEATKEAGKTLAMLVASVQEQITSATLDSKVSVSGSITKQDNSSITVEKNTFAINKDTVITSATGETITLDELLGRVTVVGTKDGNKLIAKQIISLPSEDTITATGTVKGATTKPSPEPVIVPAEETTPNATNTVQSSFIPEPAEPQYTP